MPVSEAFDSLMRDFRKRVIRIGRTYRGQSIALITICRHLAENYSNPSDNDVQTILSLADSTLLAAEEAGNNKTPKADSAFKSIRSRLEGHPMATHDGQKLLSAFLNACSKDKAATARIKVANENSSPTPTAGPRKKVHFVILKSWSWDPPPTVIKEELDDPTTIPQILWIFHNKKGEKRITLKDNPHFYLKLPPKGFESEFDSWKDGRGFHRDPLTHIGPDLEQNGTVYVILDRSSSRLYLDVAETRVFGNLWHPRKKIILKDICGVLDSEDNLRPGIEGESLDFWYRSSPNRDGTPAPHGRSFSHYGSDGDRQIKDTRFGNWRTLVHAAVKSQDIDLMIRAKHSKPAPPEWTLLPSPERPEVVRQRSVELEHPQKSHHIPTSEKPAACDSGQDPSPSNVATDSKPVASSITTTTLVNVSVNISPAVLVVATATTGCHLSPNGTGDTRPDDFNTSNNPLTSELQKGQVSEPLRPTMLSTAQNTAPSGEKTDVVRQISTAASPAQSLPPPPLTRPAQHTVFKPKPAPQKSWFQSIRDMYEGKGNGS